jgi:hypothetical protein
MKKTLRHLCLLKHYSQQSSYGNSANAPKVMNELRECDMYTHTRECYSAIKKNKIMSFAGNCMELVIIILSKISQVQKDKGHVFSLM